MTNKTAQRELVRNLYFNTSKTQKQIAEAAGVTERTVHTWIKDNSWDKLRIAAHQMPAVIASNLCAHITNLQNQISFRPPAERFPTKEEAEIIGKMILSMERLKKYPSLQQNIQMAQTFASYTMDKDPEFTKKYTHFAYDFLMGQDQFGTMPYELEYGVQHMILRDLSQKEIDDESTSFTRRSFLDGHSFSNGGSDGGKNADDDISLSINGVHEEQERSSRGEVEQQEYSQSSIDGSLQGQGKTPGGSENSQPEISSSTHPKTLYHTASQPSSDTPSKPEKTGNLSENQQQNFEPQTPQQSLDQPLHLSQIDGSLPLVEASASSPFTRHSFLDGHSFSNGGSDGGQNADDDISLSINGVHEEQERSSRGEVEQQEYSQSSIDGSLQGQGKTPGGSENSQPEISPSTHPETPYHNASHPTSDTPSEPEKTGNLSENQQQNFEPQTPQQGLDEPLHLSQIDGSLPLVEASASSPFTRHSFLDGHSFSNGGSDGGQNADDDISLSMNGVHEEQERSSRDEVEQQEYSQSSIDGSLQGQGKTPGGSENSQPEISPSTHPETPYHNASHPTSDTRSKPEKTGNLSENQQQNFEPQTPQQGLDEPLHLSQIDGSPVRTDQPGGLQRQDERRDLTFQDLEDLLNTENPDISHLTGKERSHFQRMQNIAKYKKEDEEKERIRKEQQEHEAQQEKEAQAKRQQEEFDRKRKWTADMIVFNHKNKMGKKRNGY